MDDGEAGALEAARVVYHGASCWAFRSSESVRLARDSFVRGDGGTRFPVLRFAGLTLLIDFSFRDPIGETASRALAGTNATEPCDFVRLVGDVRLSGDRIQIWEHPFRWGGSSRLQVPETSKDRGPYSGLELGGEPGRSWP